MADSQVDFESEGIVTSFVSNAELQYAFVTPTDGKVADIIYVDQK